MRTALSRAPSAEPRLPGGAGLAAGGGGPGLARSAKAQRLAERARRGESAPRRRGKAPPPPPLAKVLDTAGPSAATPGQALSAAAAAASLPARSPWKRWKKS